MNRLVVGLGNPGPRYRETRHNVGFMVVERWAAQRGWDWLDEKRWQARVARGELPNGRVWLCEPQTYMNASGESVAAVRRYFETALDGIMVVVDDANLGLGEIRMRPSGSSGGHHGLESVEAHLGSREYGRLRVGIGRRDPRQREISGHVLGSFDQGERTVVGGVIDRAVRQLEVWTLDGIQRAMNQYNGAIVAPQAKDAE